MNIAYTVNEFAGSLEVLDIPAYNLIIPEISEISNESIKYIGMLIIIPIIPNRAPFFMLEIPDFAFSFAPVSVLISMQIYKTVIFKYMYSALKIKILFNFWKSIYFSGHLKINKFYRNSKEYV